jgi:NAD(P)-dependent dehydrogenase (short-subunit alcohol dehydrogenase family)
MNLESHPLPDFNLGGRQALITGASGGLGLHMARTLARAGAHVHLGARSAAKLQAEVEAMTAAGLRASALSIDVQDPQQVEAALQQLQARIGAPLDIVVNNAGVTNTKPLLAQQPDDWDRILDTNLRGAWLVGSAAVRGMVAAGRPGVIVNIASILGERVASGVAPYSASKAGLIQLTRSMALEWARHGVRANALLPGYIATDLNREFLASEAGERLRQRVPTRRFGQAADLDGPLLLLCSEAGRHITGATLAVDGGHMINSL